MSCVLFVLSCNSSVEVPFWKVMCEHSENSSVWRRGRRAAARTSKHISVFAFDLLFSLLYILHCLTLLILYTCLILVVCPHLYWNKRASKSISTLNLEETWGEILEPLDCKKMQWELPCSLGLTGRVHEEECDESVSMFCLKTRIGGVIFLVEKKMESKEVIQRKIENLG